MKYKINKKLLLIIAIVFAFFIICIIGGYHFMSRYSALKDLQISINDIEAEVYERDQGDLNVEISDNDYLSDLQWSSSDNEIVKVNKNGHFEALKEGKATITASVKGAKSSGKCEIIVHKTIDLEEIQINNISNEKVYSGTKFKLDVALSPEDTTQKHILYQSSDSEIASVDDDGNVEAKKAGKVVITVSVDKTDIKKEVELDIEKEAAPIKSISFKEGSQLKLESGSTYQLNTIITPKGANTRGIEYTSSNKDILEVSKDGLLTAKRPGSANVVCTGDNGKKKKQINVIVKCDDGLITDSMLGESGISDCNKLMIVAHPDDETLWGGGHLLDGGWFVVCITNGYNTNRANELKNALAISDTKFIILKYPDLNQNWVKDDWSTVSNGIQNDIKKVINYKSWDKIVSHNPDGEYGHIHHKKTNKLVKKVAINSCVFDKLYYFGKFYSNDGKFYNKPILPKGLTPTYSGDILVEKNKMVNEFTTQISAINKYWNQMIPFEEWIKATDW